MRQIVLRPSLELGAEAMFEVDPGRETYDDDEQHGEAEDPPAQA